MKHACGRHACGRHACVPPGFVELSGIVGRCNKMHLLCNPRIQHSCEHRLWSLSRTKTNETSWGAWSRLVQVFRPRRYRHAFAENRSSFCVESCEGTELARSPDSFCILPLLQLVCTVNQCKFEATETRARAKRNLFSSTYLFRVCTGHACVWQGEVELHAHATPLQSPPNSWPPCGAVTSARFGSTGMALGTGGSPHAPLILSRQHTRLWQRQPGWLQAKSCFNAKKCLGTRCQVQDAQSHAHLPMRPMGPCLGRGVRIPNERASMGFRKQGNRYLAASKSSALQPLHRGKARRGGSQASANSVLPTWAAKPSDIDHGQCVHPRGPEELHARRGRCNTCRAL